MSVDQTIGRAFVEGSAIQTRQVDTGPDPLPRSKNLFDQLRAKTTPIFMSVLTVAIFAPLLFRTGTVLLLDSPQSLFGPHPHLPSQDWGVLPGLPTQAPVDTLFLALFRFLKWGPLRLLPLLLVPALAAWGFSRLFRGRSLQVIAATTLYVVNPFTYERMLAGQIYFVLGYALLPLLLSLLTASSPGLGSSVAAGLLLALLVALAPHFLFIAGLLLMVLVVASFVRRGWARLRHLGISLLVAIGASMYWLLPLSGAASGLSRLGSADLQAFRTAADPKLGLLPNVLGLYGFWRHDWPLPKDNLVVWPMFLVAILAVVLVGFAAAWRDHRLRRIAVPVGVAGIIGLFLAMGTQGPSGPMFVWLFHHVAPFRIMREPGKFLSLLVLAYAVMFGVGIEAVRAGAESVRIRRVAAVIVLTLPCLYAFRMFWGFEGYVIPSSFPSSWAQADRLMGGGPDKVLVLPWDQYLPFPFTQERDVANPLRGYFRRPAIAGDTVGLGSVQPRAATPISAYVSYLIEHGDRIHALGNLVSPLDVKYVVLAKVAEWREYDWLYRQRDLRLVRQWRDLALFENTQPVAPIYAPNRILRLEGWRQVLRVADRFRLTDYAIELGGPAEPVPTGADRRGPTGATGYQRGMTSTPVAYHVEAGHENTLVLAQPFDPSWSFKGIRPIPNLGATNLFKGVRPRSIGTIEYHHWKSVRLGFALSGMVVILSLGVIALDRRRKAAWARRVRTLDSHHPPS